MSTERGLAGPIILPSMNEAFAHAPEATHSAHEIWRDVRSAALEVAAREPLLANRLYHTVLRRESLADMLAAILAHQLARSDMPESELHALLVDVLNEDRRILADASADLDAVVTRDPACRGQLHVMLNLKGFHALQTYRIAHRLWQQGRSELALVLANIAALVFGIDIHPAARISGGAMLDHGTGIVIGETAVVEENVSILQNVTLGGTGKERGDRHPKIRFGVTIGAGAIILGNIEVGAMSKVAAGSVVLKEVPPYSTVAGVPAQVVRVNGEKVLPAFERRRAL